MYLQYLCLKSTFFSFKITKIFISYLCDLANKSTKEPINNKPTTNKGKTSAEVLQHIMMVCDNV